MYSGFDSLKSTYPETFATVRQYLLREVPAPDIADSEDFDRDSIVFRFTSPLSKRGRVIVSHEFLSDFSSSAALERLRRWNVASKARSLQRGQMLVVTTDDAYVETRSEESVNRGTSLRESAERFREVAPSAKGLKDLQDRVFSTRVDGRALGDIPSSMAGPPDFYSQFTDDFADLVASAYLLDAAGYHNVSIRHVNTLPDLQVTLEDGNVIYFEPARVELADDKHAADVREYVSGILRKRRYLDPQFAQALEGWFVSVNLPTLNIGKREREALANEITAFIKTGDFRTVDQSNIVRFESDRYPTLDKVHATVYVTQGTTYLSVQESAKTFDPYEPLRRVGQIVEAKSKLAYNANPVWLGVSLAEYVYLMSVPNAMDSRRIPRVEIDRTPFERILVGSAGIMIANIARE